MHEHIPIMPGSMPVATTRGERARREILEAARAELAEHGVDGFSLREVARRAEYSPSALYNHFEGKDALVAAVAMESLQVLGGYMAEVPADIPADERLVELGLAYLRFAREMRPHWQVIFNRLTTPAASWEQFCSYAWPFTEIIAAARQAQAEGLIAGGDPANEALGMWALAHGLATLEAAHLSGCAEDIRPHYRGLLETHLRGLAPATDHRGDDR